MSGLGGKRPGAGRPKGSKNKNPNKRRDVAQRALESGVTPLDYMLSVMRQEIPENADRAVKVAMVEQRLEAAKAAAPYVHPRLSSVEHSGGLDVGIRELTDEELDRELQRAIAEAAATGAAAGKGLPH